MYEPEGIFYDELDEAYNKWAMAVANWMGLTVSQFDDLMDYIGFIDVFSRNFGVDDTPVLALETLLCYAAGVPE